MGSDNSSALPALTRTQRARRDDIVAAAVTVLDTEGYAAASIDKIAREAGTSKGTVLYHFKTKESVYEAVVSALYANGAAYMTEQIQTVDTCRDKFHVYLASNLRFIAENASHVNAVHRIQENRPLNVDGYAAVTPLRELLQAGQRTGEFGTFDPEVLALAVRALVDGASFYFTAHPELDIEHYITESVGIFDRAIRK